MKTIPGPLAVLMLPVLLMTGCGGYVTMKREVSDIQGKTEQKVEQMQTEILQGGVESPLVKHVKTVWIGASPVPYERGSSLPPQFDEVTINFGGRHNIASVGEIIQRTTGLKVIIHPDVLVPMSKLATVSGGSTTTEGKGTVSSVGPLTTPSSVGGAGTTPLRLRIDSNNPNLSRTSPSREPEKNFAETKEELGGDYFVDVPLTYRGKLAGLLDSVTARLGLDWEYRNGALEIRRFVTRTYSIAALPGSTSYSNSLGKSGGITAGATGGTGASTGSFSSSMQVTNQSDVDYWANLEGVLSAMLSNMGRLAVNQGTGTVTVTDIRDVVDRVARHIEEENRTMTRQIAFEVQLFSVRSQDGSDFGIDWNLIYKKAGELAIDFRTPASLVNKDLVGSGSATIIRPNNNFNGSNAFLQAMASTNKVSLVTSQRAITLNRQVAPIAVTGQRSYVAESKVTTTGSGADANVSIERTVGSVTTGFILNLMPSVTDRNAMVLTVGLDLSELRALPSFGTDTNAIQLPEISATQFIQRVALRTGETLVLTGFEQVDNRMEQRSLDPSLPPVVGGSFTGNRRKDSLVFLITPVMLEGL
ncbi:MAG: PilN family type IVB pilus formation outer membrane protein [Burkholderiales bacterium]|jgi:type IVB pilus formation R64 PilN family outer membrane protein